MKQISFIFILTAKVSFFGQNVKVLTHREQVEIEPVTVLNSTYRECNLSVSPDGKELFFMSTRPSKINKIGGDGDLYKSKINEKNEWSYPVFLKDINTSNGEDEPSLSADGSTLFFQSICFYCWAKISVNNTSESFQICSWVYQITSL